MKPRRSEEELSWAEVRRVFNYDQQTGLLYCKETPKFGPAKAGDVAGSLDANGYIRVTFKMKRYLAHRLAWKWVHGVWPCDELDHEDTNGSNNALANLRPATSAQNKRNVGVSVRNTSGFKGVSFIAKSGRWQATIHLNGKNKNLGSFDTPEAAAANYRIAAEAHYGEFARAA